MPPQLKTLIPAFTIFILGFLLVRHFLTPDSFGELGHYRFNAIADNSELPMKYSGNEACTECHYDQVDELADDMHADISCETCHGPGLAHYENQDSVHMVIPDQREFCGLCHANNPARKSKIIAQIGMDDHNTEKKCIECHNPHKPWEIRE